MPYFADLSPYEYFKGANKDGRILNVGWLDRLHDYPSGSIPSGLVRKLGELCKKPVMQTRGHHICPFCGVDQSGCSIRVNEQTIRLGSAEIRVPGKLDIVYACPDLIYHYVRDHSYLPPEEFCAALESIAF